MPYKNQLAPSLNDTVSRKSAFQSNVPERAEAGVTPKNAHFHDEKLKHFQQLMRQGNSTKDTEKEASKLSEFKRKPDLSSAEKDAPLRGEFSIQEQPKASGIITPHIDKTLNNSGESKQAGANSVPSETASKLAELVQGLVSKLWVKHSEGTHQNSLTLKLDNSFLQSTTIKISHAHSQLSVHFTTSSEASYQLVMSQQRQLVSRLEKRRFAEKVTVDLDLAPKNIEGAASNSIENESQQRLAYKDEGSSPWI